MAGGKGSFWLWSSPLHSCGWCRPRACVVKRLVPVGAAGWARCTHCPSFKKGTSWQEDDGLLAFSLLSFIGGNLPCPCLSKLLLKDLEEKRTP